MTEELRNVRQAATIERETVEQLRREIADEHQAWAVRRMSLESRRRELEQLLALARAERDRAVSGASQASDVSEAPTPARTDETLTHVH